ncbi:MAG: hypothetical protein Q4D12_05930, partial [Bacteroidales bacterium]|nr:hypothetical protein [Bacteroidales bacterium]
MNYLIKFQKNIQIKIRGGHKLNIKSILGELTLEEKAKLTMGKNNWNTWNIDRLKIPSIKMSDGPHGLRNQDDSVKNSIEINNSIQATCF